MSDAYTLNKVTFSYPLSKVAAVKELTFSVEQGKTTVLLGPNGAGKSTLMDLLLNWIKADSGLISLYGKPIYEYHRKELGKIVSLVPQKEISRFPFTVTEYVLFGRSAHMGFLENPKAKDIEIALKTMESVGILPIANRLVTTLSGGESQLLLLARALAQQPKVLLLDEPSSSLDPSNTALVVSILKSLAKENITLFFTTHDPIVASECADNVIMLRDGNLLFSGPGNKAFVPSVLTDLYKTGIDTLAYKDKTIIFPTF